MPWKNWWEVPDTQTHNFNLPFWTRLRVSHKTGSSINSLPRQYLFLGIAAAYPQCIRPYVDSLRQLSSSSNSRIIERIINLAGLFFAVFLDWNILLRVSSRASHSGSHMIPPEPTAIYALGPHSNDSLTRNSHQRINRYNSSNILTRYWMRKS